MIDKLVIVLQQTIVVLTLALLLLCLSSQCGLYCLNPIIQLTYVCGSFKYTGVIWFFDNITRLVKSV